MKNREVLILAPRPDNVERLKGLLMQGGVSITGTTDTGDAVASFRRTPPDVLIVDPDTESAGALLDMARSRPGTVAVAMMKPGARAGTFPNGTFAQIVIQDEHFEGCMMDTVGQLIDIGLSPSCFGPPAPRLLVVEDHPDTLELYMAYLSQEGREVLPATTGEEALDILEQESSIDVVLLDVMLPGLGGIGTLDALMKKESHPGVLMVSAVSDKEFVARAYALGASDYLVKPVDWDQLETSIMACVDRTGGPDGRAR